MNFGEILSKAWKTVWKYKVLWIFGILASLGQGGGGGGGGGGGSNSNGSMDGNLEKWFGNNQFNVPPELQQGFEQFGQTISDIPWFVWVLIGLGFLLLILVTMFLSTVGKIGLIDGTRQSDEGVASLSFGPLFSQSLRYFWRVFLFDLLAGLAMFILVLILMTPFFLLTLVTLGVGALCLVPLICLMVPAFALIGIIIEQGEIAIVVENVGVIEGLRRGWKVLKENFWNMVLMALILGFGAGIIGIIIALPFLIVAIPIVAALFSNGYSNIEGITNTLLISGALCCLVYPIVLVLNGILTAYVRSAWTLTYLRVTRKPELPVATEPPAVLETV